jgi:Tfp pilus assembly protein PilN
MPSATYGAVTRTLQGGGLLDLTLDSWRLSASAKRDRRRLLGLSVIILCVWGVLVGSGLGWIELEKMRLGRLKKEDEELAGPANKVRKLRLQASMIERYTDRTYSALECLREISRLLPDGVDLTSFSYRKGESIDIGGEADSGTLVNRFNEALNQSKLFGDVKSGAHTLTKKGRRRFSFDIKFPENK